MKDSLFRKNGQAERSYRIGLSLLSLAFLLAVLFTDLGGLCDRLTNQEALRRGFLYPIETVIGLDQLSTE